MSRSLAFLLLAIALSISAQQPATLRGTVTNGTTHQPVEGANVDVSCSRGDSLTALTASDGTYSVSVNPGQCFVQASDGTHAALWNQINCLGPDNVMCGSFGDPIDVAAGDVRGGIDFAFTDHPPFGTIKGTLTLPNGQPYAGGGIQFYDPHTGLKYRGRAAKIDGTFSFNLPPRDWLVMSTDGYLLHTLTDGTVCVDPCSWRKSAAMSLAAGATITANLVMPGAGITDVTPDNGPQSGGTPVTINGYWPDPRQSVTIGALAAPAVVESFTSLHATTPPGGGDADVKIAGPFTSFTLPKGFHYTVAGESYLALTTTTSRLRLGDAAAVTVTISPARLIPTAVALANSNPECLQLPANIAIPAGRSSVTIPVQTLAYGGGRITASASGARSSALTLLVDAPAVTLTIPPHVDTTKDAAGTITIDPVQTSDTVLFLWGVDEFVSKPLIMPAGQTSLDFSLRDIYGTPHFQIYYPPSLGGQVAADATLNGPETPRISTSAPAYHVTVGKPATGRVVLSNWASYSIYVPFFSSSPNVTIAPVTVGSGAIGADFTINASAPGITTVTATTRAGTFTFEVDAATDDAVARRRTVRH